MSTPPFNEMPSTLIGLKLLNVRVAGAELVITFTDSVHLICKPEGLVDKKGKPQVTGMKYDVAKGPLTILQAHQCIAGAAAECLLEEVTATQLDPNTGTFAIRLGSPTASSSYTLMISPALGGIQVMKTKVLNLDWRAPLVGVTN